MRLTLSSTLLHTGESRQSASLTSSTALPALASQIAEATGKTKELFGPDDSSKKEVESWLSKIDAGQEGDVQVSGLDRSTALTMAAAAAAILTQKIFRNYI